MWGSNKVDCIRRWLRRSRELALLIFLTHFAPDVLADGCFVFKWDKKIDTNEPTQKAIIVFDSGREEILLQAKYEGPLEEFGWLIPTPSLPKVEKGSMEPFYELSQLTQRRFGRTLGIAGTKGMEAARAGREEVEVIETKTVGAYEATVLSAQDSGSLARWLAAHDYSFPEGKSEIVDEYIRRGWYFIAAKIQLNAGLGFKTIAASETKNPQSRTSARKAIQSKLSSGELHPLLIKFDTPKAVFPLKISAVGGKPSEVSLYLIAKEALLEEFIFGKAIEHLGKQFITWKEERPNQRRRQESSHRNMRAMSVGFFLDSFYTTKPGERLSVDRRDYSKEDIERIAGEGQPPLPEDVLGPTFYPAPEEMLQCMQLTSEKIPKCSAGFPRLEKGNWYLTKLVHTFAPAEMRDLEFERAIPALGKLLPENAGGTAGQILLRLGDNGDSLLRRAATNADSSERLSVTLGIERERCNRLNDILAVLLKDDSPAVRLHALRAIDAAPDQRFTETVLSLLRDSSREIAREASGYLSNHEPTNRTPIYLALMKDPDPNVRGSALGIAIWMNRSCPRPKQLHC
jgi:hypothetical protein